MRKTILWLLLLAGFLPAQAPPVTGRWVVTADFYGTPLNFMLQLNQDGDKLTGEFDGDKLEGSRKGDAIRFIAKDEEGGTEDVTATVQGGAISGTVIFTSGSNPGHPSMGRSGTE